MEVGHVAIENKTKNVLKTNDTNAIEIVFNDKQTVFASYPFATTAYGRLFVKRNIALAVSVRRINKMATRMVDARRGRNGDADPYKPPKVKIPVLVVSAPMLISNLEGFTDGMCSFSAARLSLLMAHIAFDCFLLRFFPSIRRIERHIYKYDVI